MNVLKKFPQGDTHGHPWLRITDLKGKWSMVPCLDYNARGSPAKEVYFSYVFFSVVLTTVVSSMFASSELQLCARMM